MLIVLILRTNLFPPFPDRSAKLIGTRPTNVRLQTQDEEEGGEGGCRHRRRRRREKAAADAGEE